MKPALDAEQWELGYVRDDVSIEPWPDGSARLSLYVLDACDLTFEDGGTEHADASADLTPEDRHALAAFCLDGQPFGFRWEDVDEIRRRANSRDQWSTDEELLLHSLADRIEALLRPRKEES